MATPYDERPDVDILLATCDGAAYLAPLVASIARQSHPNWRLLIRDDASVDATPALIGALAGRDPERITVLAPSRQRLGPAQAFSRLLQQARAPYVMFCDQDDIWRPKKVADTLARMRAAERRHGAATPILVHTDLAVVDRHLNLINPSFFACRRLDPAGRVLNRLLVQNVITGCTVMINASLRRRVGVIPSEARMHDWWVGLVAAAVGRIEFIPLPSVCYRQHPGNVVGVRSMSASALLHHARRLRRLRRDLRDTLAQGRRLLRMHGPHMAPAARRTCADFAALADAGWLQKRRLLVRGRFYKPDVWRNLALFLLI